MPTEADIRDPARRRLLAIADNAMAEAGTLQTTQPAVSVPAQFDTTPTDTGIRESIMAGTEAAFQSNLAQIQENAVATRRFRAGSTSARELEAARAAQSERISKLGSMR